jgi:hypothetical protein
LCEALCCEQPPEGEGGEQSDHVSAGS